MEIEKATPTKLFTDEADIDEWRTLDASESFAVAEALAEPLRQWIYQTLEKGPLRQSELAKRASEFFKRKITNVLMRYHLQKLERAGLVRFESEPGKRVKVVHRVTEVKVQIRSYLGPAEGGGSLDEEFHRIFRSRSRR